MIDLKKAAESKTYCDEIKGVAKQNGVEITELSTHLQGQLVAVHPAYDEAFDAFAPASFHGKPKERQAWAVQQVKHAAKASRNLGLGAHVSFPGALCWPFMYGWPPRPAGLIEEGFDELARRWKPLLDVFDENGRQRRLRAASRRGIMDGATFEMFLERLNNHPRCMINYDPSHFVLQQLDYLAFIDIYKDRICAFHVKDAEFNPTGKQASIPASSPGSTAPAASVRWATGRWISRRSSPRWRRTTTTPGPCWNGVPASRIRCRAPSKARPSSRATSSR